jgi:hypothetical protein
MIGNMARGYDIYDANLQREGPGLADPYRQKAQRRTQNTRAQNLRHLRGGDE